MPKAPKPSPELQAAREALAERLKGAEVDIDVEQTRVATRLVDEAEVDRVVEEMIAARKRRLGRS